MIRQLQHRFISPIFLGLLLVLLIIAPSRIVAPPTNYDCSSNTIEPDESNGYVPGQAIEINVCTDCTLRLRHLYVARIRFTQACTFTELTVDNVSSDGTAGASHGALLLFHETVSVTGKFEVKNSKYIRDSASAATVASHSLVHFEKSVTLSQNMTFDDNLVTVEKRSGNGQWSAKIVHSNTGVIFTGSGVWLVFNNNSVLADSYSVGAATAAANFGMQPTLIFLAETADALEGITVTSSRVLLRLSEENGDSDVNGTIAPSLVNLKKAPPARIVVGNSSIGCFESAGVELEYCVVSDGTGSAANVHEATLVRCTGDAGKPFNAEVDISASSMNLTMKAAGGNMIGALVVADYSDGMKVRVRDDSSVLLAATRDGSVSTQNAVAGFVVSKNDLLNAALWVEQSSVLLTNGSGLTVAAAASFIKYLGTVTNFSTLSVDRATVECSALSGVGTASAIVCAVGASSVNTGLFELRTMSILSSALRIRDVKAQNIYAASAVALYAASSITWLDISPPATTTTTITSTTTSTTTPASSITSTSGATTTTSTTTTTAAPAAAAPSDYNLLVDNSSLSAGGNDGTSVSAPGSLTLAHAAHTADTAVTVVFIFRDSLVEVVGGKVERTGNIASGFGYITAWLARSNVGYNATVDNCAVIVRDGAFVRTTDANSFVALTAVAFRSTGLFSKLVQIKVSGAAVGTEGSGRLACNGDSVRAAVLFCEQKMSKIPVSTDTADGTGGNFLLANSHIDVAVNESGANSAGLLAFAVFLADVDGVVLDDQQRSLEFLDSTARFDVQLGATSGMASQLSFLLVTAAVRMVNISMVNTSVAAKAGIAASNGNATVVHTIVTDGFSDVPVSLWQQTRVACENLTVASGPATCGIAVFGTNADTDGLVGTAASGVAPSQSFVDSIVTVDHLDADEDVTLNQVRYIGKTENISGITVSGTLVNITGNLKSRVTGVKLRLVRIGQTLSPPPGLTGQDSALLIENNSIIMSTPSSSIVAAKVVSIVAGVQLANAALAATDLTLISIFNTTFAVVSSAEPQQQQITSLSESTSIFIFEAEKTTAVKQLLVRDCGVHLGATVVVKAKTQIALSVAQFNGDYDSAGVSAAKIELLRNFIRAAQGSLVIAAPSTSVLIFFCKAFNVVGALSNVGSVAIDSVVVELDGAVAAKELYVEAVHFDSNVSEVRTISIANAALRIANASASWPGLAAASKYSVSACFFNQYFVTLTTSSGLTFLNISVEFAAPESAAMTTPVLQVAEFFIAHFNALDTLGVKATFANTSFAVTTDLLLDGDDFRLATGYLENAGGFIRTWQMSDVHLRSSAVRLSAASALAPSRCDIVHARFPALAGDDIAQTISITDFSIVNSSCALPQLSMNAIIASIFFSGVVDLAAALSPPTITAQRGIVEGSLVTLNAIKLGILFFNYLVRNVDNITVTDTALISPSTSSGAHNYVATILAPVGFTDVRAVRAHNITLTGTFTSTNIARICGVLCQGVMGTAGIENLFHLWASRVFVNVTSTTTNAANAHVLTGGVYSIKHVRNATSWRFSDFDVHAQVLWTTGATTGMIGSGCILHVATALVNVSEEMLFDGVRCRLTVEAQGPAQLTAIRVGADGAATSGIRNVERFSIGGGSSVTVAHVRTTSGTVLSALLQALRLENVTVFSVADAALQVVDVRRAKAVDSVGISTFAVFAQAMIHVRSVSLQGVSVVVDYAVGNSTSACAVALLAVFSTTTGSHHIGGMNASDSSVTVSTALRNIRGGVTVAGLLLLPVSLNESFDDGNFTVTNFTANLGNTEAGEPGEPLGGESPGSVHFGVVLIESDFNFSRPISAPLAAGPAFVISGVNVPQAKLRCFGCRARATLLMISHTASLGSGGTFTPSQRAATILISDVDAVVDLRLGGGTEATHAEGAVVDLCSSSGARQCVEFSRVALDNVRLQAKVLAQTSGNMTPSSLYQMRLLNTSGFTLPGPSASPSSSSSPGLVIQNSELFVDMYPKNVPPANITLLAAALFEQPEPASLTGDVTTYALISNNTLRIDSGAVLGGDAATACTPQTCALLRLGTTASASLNVTFDSNRVETTNYAGGANASMVALFDSTSLASGKSSFQFARNSMTGAAPSFVFAGRPAMPLLGGSIDLSLSTVTLYCNLWPRGMDYALEAAAGSTAAVERLCTDTRTVTVTRTPSKSRSNTTFNASTTSSTTTTSTTTNTSTTSTTSSTTSTTSTTTSSSTSTSSSTTLTSSTTTQPTTTTNTTTTTSTTTIPPTTLPPNTTTSTPAPNVTAEPVPEIVVTDALVASVGAVSSVATVASAPTAVRGLSVLTIASVAGLCRNGTGGRTAKALSFPLSLMPFLWLGGPDDPQAPHRGAVLANAILAPFIAVVLALSVWFAVVLCKRRKRQGNEGGDAPITLASLAADAGVAGRVHQMAGFSIDGALGSAVFLAAAEGAAAGDVVFGVFGFLVTLAVFCSLLRFVHTRIFFPGSGVRFVPAALLDDKAVMEPDTCRERTWRTILGHGCWRPPAPPSEEATAVNPALLDGVSTTRWYFQVFLPCFGKARGPSRLEEDEADERTRREMLLGELGGADDVPLLDVGNNTSNNMSMTATSSANNNMSMATSNMSIATSNLSITSRRRRQLQKTTRENRGRLPRIAAFGLFIDVLITGALGACRGYAMAHPCKAHRALIGVVMINTFALIETVILQSYSSPLRQLLDTLSTLLLWVASVMGLKNITTGLEVVAVLSIVLAVLSAIVHRVLSFIANVCLHIRLVPVDAVDAELNKKNNQSGSGVGAMLASALLDDTNEAPAAAVPAPPAPPLLPPPLLPPPQREPEKQPSKEEFSDDDLLPPPTGPTAFELELDELRARMEEDAGGDDVEIDLTDFLGGGGIDIGDEEEERFDVWDGFAADGGDADAAAAGGGAFAGDAAAYGTQNDDGQGEEEDDDQVDDGTVKRRRRGETTVVALGLEGAAGYEDEEAERRRLRHLLDELEDDELEREAERKRKEEEARRKAQGPSNADEASAMRAKLAALMRNR